MISKVAVLRRGRPRDAASGIVQLNALRARWRESRWKMRLCVVARSTVEMIVLKQREVGHMGQSVSLGVLSTNESCGEQQIVVWNRPSVPRIGVPSRHSSSHVWFLRIPTMVSEKNGESRYHDTAYPVCRTP
ncbi:hypothetical protein BS47DRAFT_257159 [Hydnum rufescens UP504]|uniref:Uncharacterized protein n=1 Tax=Hydnum rufescens UP504 TaxID=1448309 RepID=A0A9P6B746_9AGAM|nr:hypothetical protein BS47DRAFT_257159 [Hydnum rufescens UP504]